MDLGTQEVSDLLGTQEVSGLLGTQEVSGLQQWSGGAQEVNDLLDIRKKKNE